MLAPLALTCLILAWAGVFSRFWFWTFTYAANYGSHEPWREGIKHLHDYFQQKQEVYLGFLVLAGAGLPLALRQKAIRDQVFFGYKLPVIFASRCGGGTLFPGGLLSSAPSFRSHDWRGNRLVTTRLEISHGKNDPIAAPGGGSELEPVFAKRLFFPVASLQVCRIVYGANPLLESQMAAEYIRGHSAEGARIAVVGSEPQIYFYSRRHSATGYLYTYDLVQQQPYAAKMQQEMIREIESNRAEFIILVLYRYSWLFKDSSDTTILGWAKKYSDEFYEIAGVINASSNGEITCLWDEAAKSYRRAV